MVGKEGGGNGRCGTERVMGKRATQRAAVQWAMGKEVGEAGGEGESKRYSEGDGERGVRPRAMGTGKE